MALKNDVPCSGAAPGPLAEPIQCVIGARAGGARLAGPRTSSPSTAISTSPTCTPALGASEPARNPATCVQRRGAWARLGGSAAAGCVAGRPGSAWRRGHLEVAALGHVLPLDAESNLRAGGEKIKQKKRSAAPSNDLSVGAGARDACATRRRAAGLSPGPGWVDGRRGARLRT